VFWESWSEEKVLKIREIAYNPNRNRMRPTMRIIVYEDSTECSCWNAAATAMLDMKTDNVEDQPVVTDNVMRLV
jgi:hypothetical protein